MLELDHEWLDQLLAYLEKNYKSFCSYLNDAVPELLISPLEATYLVWLDFSFLRLNDETLKNFIIYKAGLGLNDGPMFGPGGSQHQRLNLACPEKILMEGAGRLAVAIEDEENDEIEVKNSKRKNHHESTGVE